MFNHPYIEVWHSAFPGQSYPKDYKTYLAATRLPWCGCGGTAFAVPDKPSISPFLNILANDIVIVTCNAVIKKFKYLSLPKSLEEYKKLEDEYVKAVVKHLDTPNKDRISVYVFIQEELKIEPEYEYLLMNYLETAGYMEHGTSIRVGYKP